MDSRSRVNVGVSSEIIAAVPEPSLNIFQGIPQVQHDGSTAVTKVMEPNSSETIRKQGYALDDEEYELGIRCVGTVLKNIAGAVVGGLSISGTEKRMTDEVIEEMIADLKRSAEEISRRIGYNT